MLEFERNRKDKYNVKAKLYRTLIVSFMIISRIFIYLLNIIQMQPHKRNTCSAILMQCDGAGMLLLAVQA